MEPIVTNFEGDTEVDNVFSKQVDQPTIMLVEKEDGETEENMICFIVGTEVLSIGAFVKLREALYNLKEIKAYAAVEPDTFVMYVKREHSAQLVELLVGFLNDGSSITNPFDAIMSELGRLLK